MDFSFGDLIDSAEGAISDVADAVSDVVDDVEDTVSDAVDDVEDTVSDVVDDVEDTVSDAVDDVEDTVSDAVDDVEDTVSDAVDDVEDAVSDAVDDVEDTVSDVVDDVEDAVDDVSDAVAGATSAIADACEDWASDAEEAFTEDYKLVVGSCIDMFDSAEAECEELGGATKLLDAFQMGLNVVGLIPGVGALADGTNAIIYAMRGDYVDAGLSVVGCIPFVGIAAAGAKLIKGAEVIEDADDAYKVAKEIDEADEAYNAVEDTDKASEFAEDTGDLGDSGDAGDYGDSGDEGDYGDSGDEGDYGDSGDEGDYGDSGDEGDYGDSGDEGNDGGSGDSGDDGGNNENLDSSSNKTQENVCENGDPIDSVTGSLIIRAVDIVLPDTHEEFKIEREYKSLNPGISPIGRGWKPSFNSFLDIKSEKVKVLCTDGHVETFDKIAGEWSNDKGGSKTYTLHQEKDCWIFKSSKDKKTYKYDTSGKLLNITNKFGNKLTIEYIGENIESLTTFSNYKLFFTYRDGKVTEIKDELDRKVKYKYDGDYLTHVFHVDKGVTKYTYDDKGYISSITDQNGNTYTKNFFDRKGRVIKQEYPNGDLLTVNYDDGERESTFYFHASKRIEKNKYNSDNLVTHIIYEDGSTEEYKYDAYENKIYIKDRNGFETHRVYDEFGNLLKETLPNGLITEYAYDENGNVTKETDNEEKEIINAYDSNGNLIEKKTKISIGNWKTESYTYDSHGRILSKTDGNGNTSRYEYEYLGGLERKQGKDPVRVITSSGYVYEYTYDKVGRNTEIKTDYGTLEFSYNHLNYVGKIKDANGNVTIKNYDNMGNLISLYTPNACINGSFADEGYKYTYDHMDRLISIKNPLGIMEKSIRDTEGNIIKEINPNYYNAESHDGVGVEYAYDKDNRKIKTIYPDGGIERFIYDSNGNVVKHISPEYYKEETDDGLGYSYTYDSMNRLSSIINEEGITEKAFEYDLNGNIIKEIDNEGNATLFKYDLLGNITEKRVPVEKDETEIKYNVTCYAYDKNSNKILEKHGTTLVSENEVCNSYHEIYFEYDKENRLIEVKDKYGAKAKYKYDCLNNKTYESFKINDTTTKAIHYIYDKVGNLIQKKEEIDGGFVSPETAGRNIFAITSYEYDKNGNITKIITPKGYEIERVYDKADRLIEQYEKDETNGIFRSYVYKYDKANNVTSISEYSGEEAKLISGKYASENDYTVHWSERHENRKENEELFEKLNFKEDQKKKTYVYDSQNRLTHFTNFSGNTTRLFYDKNDRIIKQVLPEQYDEAKDNGVGTTYNYNLKGQVIEVKNALGETITKNTYDPKGNLKTRVDGENNKVEYTYTLLGQIKDIVTANSKKENKSAQSYKYDTRGNITGITDGNGNETSYLLDDWGRIIQITTPEGGVEKYTYDYAGNITRTTDANGNTIEYFYNNLGQVCEIRDQEGNSEYFYYDSEGNLTKHIDRNQNQVDRTYNLDRNIVSVKAYQIDKDALELEEKKSEEVRVQAMEEADKNADEDFIVSPLAQTSRKRNFTERLKDKKERKEQEVLEENNKTAEDLNKHKLNVIDQRFNYNPDGTLKSAYSGNMQYEYTYNIEGMLESKSASGKTLLKYTYDKNNNIKSIKDITGKSSIYSYDEENRVKLIQDDNQNNLAVYDYYKNNNIKSVTVGNGLKTEYTYDGDGNVQSLVTISQNGEVLIDYNYAYDLNGNRLQKVSSKHKNFYTYDSMNRLKEVSYDGRKESFTYDKVGNRLTKTTNDITEKYIYNVKNQLKELHNNSGINYFTYDKQGNTIKEETQNGNNIFEYNTLNQQVKAVTKEGNTLVSRYDTEGLRAEIEENEKLTKFIFHKDNILVETDKDYNVVSRFTRGYEVVAADISEANEGLEFNLNRYYYTTDEQGSTVFITDKNQSIRNEYYYDAFGNVLEAQEEVHNRITYTGQQYDGITGQYYLRARFYNPVIGRFTQEDIYRGDGLNLYAYCGNNPVAYYDPSGYVCSTKINQLNDEEKTMRQDGTRLEYLRNKFNKGATEAGKLKSVGNGVWESTEGLIYGQGSKQGNRVLHVLEHAAPDPTKPLHTVFNVPKDKVLGVVDEAWSMRSSVTPILQKNGNQLFNIPVGRVVGTNGETSIRILVKNGTSEVVTAFPVK